MGWVGLDLQVGFYDAFNNKSGQWSYDWMRVSSNARPTKKWRRLRGTTFHKTGFCTHARVAGFGVLAAGTYE